MMDGMRMQELSTDCHSPPTEGGMAPLALFDTLREAQEYALVVLAMNLDCLITAEENSFVIHVDEPFTIAVRNEFRLYEEEQEDSRPPEVLPVFGSGVELLLMWIATLFFCYTMQLEQPGFTDAYLNSSAGVMQHGEIYRPLTALFLHGSMEHLLGNLAMGSVFCLLVANSLGPWTGWSLIFVSGALGNLTNAALHHDSIFLSLGASTATFGALGLLVGVGFYQSWLERSMKSGIRVLVPLAIGVMFFAMYGIGKPNPEAPTDIMAHALGLFFGAILGFPFAVLRHRRG